MDEPFSALDVLTAETLRGELLELWTSRKIPTNAIFMVTHNIEEAVELADRIIVLAHRPAHIHDDFEVGLAHPRDRKSPRFLELVDHVYKVLTLPDEAHVLPSERPEREKHAPLPHARPGGIAGLVEILGDRGGQDDLFHLAEELVMELDDLLPIVEAAALLGFVEVSEGDARLTAAGRAFADAGIEQRKQIFREAALERIALLRQMQSALRSKANLTLPAEFFRDILDERFDAREAEHQFDTAVDWGRYAEIFEFDPATDHLMLQDGSLSETK
jgi:NitT/TauT family transport system ATP-binding protein